MQRYINWIHLVDMTGDGAPDLVVDNASYQLGWANDGNGYFTFTGGWLKVIWTTPLVGGTFSPPAPGHIQLRRELGRCCRSGISPTY